MEIRHRHHSLQWMSFFAASGCLMEIALLKISANRAIVP
jgi:hypothetical protein